MTENKRLAGIRSMLKDPEAQTAPNNQARGWRTDCEYLVAKVDELADDLGDVLTALRNFVGHCPDCQGAGVTMVVDSSGDDDEVHCEFCGPTHRLIERLMPPPPQSEPVVEVEVVEVEENDIPF